MMVDQIMRQVLMQARTDANRALGALLPIIPASAVKLYPDDDKAKTLYSYVFLHALAGALVETCRGTSSLFDDVGKENASSRSVEMMRMLGGSAKIAVDETLAELRSKE